MKDHELLSEVFYRLTSLCLHVRTAVEEPTATNMQQLKAMEQTVSVFLSNQATTVGGLVGRLFMEADEAKMADLERKRAVLCERVAALSAQCDALAGVLSELYQVLGALGATEAVMDQVSAAIDGRPLIHKTLLPYVVDEGSGGAPAEPVGEVVSKYGDPARFAERELSMLQDITTLPVGTKLYAAAPVRFAFPTMLRKMWSGGEIQDWLNRQGPLLKPVKAQEE